MKEYLCRKIDHEIKVDGNINKPEWKSAEIVQLSDSPTGGEPRLKTAAMLLWSNKHLYVAFSCEDDEILATMTGYNDHLFDEDVVEIFLDDDCDRKGYVEFEVSPVNSILHYYIQNTVWGLRQFARTVKTVDSAVSHDGPGMSWTAELAIPFDELSFAANAAPKSGDGWLMNLYRIDRVKNGADGYYAWSPTLNPSFHRPERFGKIIFTE